MAQEALLAGVPLVATRVGGIPELVGEAAVLVDPDDADAAARGRPGPGRRPRRRGAGSPDAGLQQAATWPGRGRRGARTWLRSTGSPGGPDAPLPRLSRSARPPTADDQRAPMTQTPADRDERAQAAFAIEGVPVQTPARIAWGLGAGDLALGGLGLVTLLVAALGAPASVVLVLGVVLAVLVALGVRAGVAQPLSPGSAGSAALLVVAAAAAWPCCRRARDAVVPAAPARRRRRGARSATPASRGRGPVQQPPARASTSGPSARFRPRWVGYAGCARPPSWCCSSCCSRSRSGRRGSSRWPRCSLAGAALVDAALWVLQRRRAERRLTGR